VEGVGVGGGCSVCSMEEGRKEGRKGRRTVPKDAI